MIFLEAALRIADCTDDAISEIVQASDIIDYRRGRIRGICVTRIEQQGVNREIAPQHILPGVAFKNDRVRMSAIAVGVIAAKCRDLHTIHQHDTKLSSDQLRAREKLDQTSWDCVRGDVIIFGFAAENEVANAASHKPGLVPMRAQYRRDVERAIEGCSGNRHASDRRIRAASTFPLEWQSKILSPFRPPRSL